jgi:hypothetical protein
MEETGQDVYLIYELLNPFVVILVKALNCDYSPIPEFS